MLLIFGVMGVMSLLLRGFSRRQHHFRHSGPADPPDRGDEDHRRAQGGQIVGMYLVTTTIFSVLALMVAIPLGWLGMRANTNFMAGLDEFRHA